MTFRFYMALIAFFAAALAGMALSPPDLLAQLAVDDADVIAEEEESSGLAARLGWKRRTLRFVTDSDYPPFNYIDEEGALTGFNIDLARAICLQLEVECDIKTKRWDDLIPTVKRLEADAIIATLTMTHRSLQDLDFTKRYLHTPARFAALKKSEFEDVIPEDVEGEKIGVVKGTAHEAYLKDFFKGSKIVGFPDDNGARAALKEGIITLLFGDGISLMFWINGLDSGGCCAFAGGAFVEAKYFGDGIGIAVKKGDRLLRDILNVALLEVRKSGRIEELHLRYFPLRFY